MGHVWFVEWVTGGLHMNYGMYNRWVTNESLVSYRQVTCEMRSQLSHGQAMYESGSGLQMGHIWATGGVMDVFQMDHMWVGVSAGW